MIPAGAMAVALSIAVDRVPLRTGAPPIVERGRVLVPLRALVEALNADIAYDAASRTILLHRGNHQAHVTLGSRAAAVDGKTVTLDVAARSVRGRTYVPLRFAGEALGAHVTYEGANKTVAIDTHGEPVVAARPPSVEFRRPGPGEIVTGGYVSISASLETHGGPPVDETTVRMFVDERDVTDRIYHAGDSLSYTPSRELPAGMHEVTVQGADQDGTRFTSNWDFQSSFVPPSGPSYLGPSFGGFYVSGPLAYYSAGSIGMYLSAPPGGYGYVNLCGYAQQYPFAYGGTNHYFVNVPIPVNLYAPACYVSGFFFDASGNRSYIALQTPIVINTVITNGHTITIKPSPSPTPSPTPKPFVPHIIHIHPSPTPHATRRPTPKPTA